MPITPRPKTPRETSRDVPSTRLQDLRRAAAAPSAASEAEHDQALDTLLGRGRERVEDGATPRLPVQSYLAALQPVLEFVRSQPALMDEPSLSPAMCRAALRVAQELTGGATGEPLRIPPPLTVRHEEALRTGVLLLCAYRAAVERGLSPDPERAAEGAGESEDVENAEDVALRAELAPLTQRARAEFGLDEALNLGSVRDGALLADRIARFLTAAERFPEHLIAAELTGAQLMGLMAQERVLRALAVQRDEASLLPGQPFRAQVLHAALECFFDRYSAALWVRLIDLPMARAAGLRLLPRPGGPRSSGRPTTSGHPGLDLAACRITESGRLIFS